MGGFAAGWLSMLSELVWLERVITLDVMLYNGLLIREFDRVGGHFIRCFKIWVWSYSDSSLVHYAYGFCVRGAYSHWLTISWSGYWWFWVTLCWFGLKERWRMLRLTEGCWNVNLSVLAVDSFVVSSEDSHKSVLIFCIRFGLMKCWGIDCLWLERVINAYWWWCRELMVCDKFFVDSRFIRQLIDPVGAHKHRLLDLTKVELSVLLVVFSFMVYSLGFTWSGFISPQFLCIFFFLFFNNIWALDKCRLRVGCQFFWDVL